MREVARAVVVKGRLVLLSDTFIDAPLLVEFVASFRSVNARF